MPLVHTRLLLLARRGNPEINRWLEEHPAVLGLIFLAIGVALLGSAVNELRTGVVHDKRGNELTGGTAKVTTFVRLVAGIGCCGFGLFKLVAG
jgi:hypothetical protein